MTAALATVAGHQVTRLELHVPHQGPWWYDVDLAGDEALEGSVVAQVGDLELVGTVDAAKAGAFALQRRARVVAGAGGWGTLLGPRAYHSDSGVNPLLVAQDAARGAGETLGDFTPSAGLGRDYVRQSGPAARVLEDVAGGVPWWVGFDGVTHVAQRPEAPAPEDGYELLDYDPRRKVARLTVDDLGRFGPGAVISQQLEQPETIREVTVVIEAEDLQVIAWVGGDPSARGRLTGILRGITRRSSDDRLWGKWRYRVVRMSVDRVELQAVHQADGLPDVLPVDMWPGVAGVWADLTPGTHVLVEFIGGRRTDPVITGFAPKGGPGFVPVAMHIAGDSSSPQAARKGDSVRVTIPTGTQVVNPETGQTTTNFDIDGEITEGSGKVRIG